MSIFLTSLTIISHQQCLCPSLASSLAQIPYTPPKELTSISPPPLPVYTSHQRSPSAHNSPAVSGIASLAFTASRWSRRCSRLPTCSSRRTFSVRSWCRHDRSDATEHLYGTGRAVPSPTVQLGGASLESVSVVSYISLSKK